MSSRDVTTHPESRSSHRQGIPAPPPAPHARPRRTRLRHYPRKLSTTGVGDRQDELPRAGTHTERFFLAPIVIRLGIQVRLYLAGRVSWLATSRVALGWPLHAATLAVAGLILMRGRTPLLDSAQQTPN